MDSAIRNIKEEGITKLGIMGGSFDPIHMGHLIVANSALEAFGLEKILFIPTGNPPHKDPSRMSDAIHRLEMTKLATQNNEQFSVSSLEVNRSNTSYTIDTISVLTNQWDREIACYFIIGTDALMELETWKSYKQLLKTTNMIVTTRAGHDDQLIHKRIKYFKESLNVDILKMEIPGIEISSTEIRKRIREGRSIRYFVPMSVEAYIHTNKLYR